MTTYAFSLQIRRSLRRTCIRSTLNTCDTTAIPGRRPDYGTASVDFAHRQRARNALQAIPAVSPAPGTAGMAVPMKGADGKEEDSSAASARDGKETSSAGARDSEGTGGPTRFVARSHPAA